VQTGQVPFSVVWISLSIGCVVTGLIQANDIHDVVYDRVSGIRTMALTIGQERAMAMLSLIYISAYLILFVSVALGFLPWPALAPVLALPELIRTIHGLASKSRRERTVAGLVYWAAGFHAKFGALLIVGIILYLVFIR
jgi:1,4-dihydroxy-2-naphthoate octaprenyltransferase